MLEEEVEGAEREISLMADIQYYMTQHGTNWDQKVAGNNPKSFINFKMFSLKIWVKKYNNKWKGQKLILLTLHSYVQVFSPIQKSMSPVYFFLLQEAAIHWLRDSGFAVQGGQDLLSVSFQGHENFRSSGTVNSTGISRRGGRMAPYITSPASRILQGQSGRSDHRAVVPMTDCFSARQREVGAASRHRATAVQRKNQNIPCVYVEEKMPSIAHPHISHLDSCTLRLSG